MTVVQQISPLAVQDPDFLISSASFMWAYFCINSPVVEKKAETTVTSTPINHGCMMKAVQSVRRSAVRLCVASLPSMAMHAVP